SGRARGGRAPLAPPQHPAAGIADDGGDRADQRLVHQPTSTRVARPRKQKKPITSVTVVRKMALARAGSKPRRLSVSGTSTPARLANSRLAARAVKITADSCQSPNHSQTTSERMAPRDRKSTRLNSSHVK